MTDVGLDKYIFGQLLAIAAGPGKNRAFLIRGENGVTTDRDTLRKVHDFLRSKLKTPPR